MADSLRDFLEAYKMPDDGYWYMMGVSRLIRGDGSAAGEYRRFLNDWKQADDDLPVIVEARERLARLQNCP